MIWTPTENTRSVWIKSKGRKVMAEKTTYVRSTMHCTSHSKTGMFDSCLKKTKTDLFNYICDYKALSLETLTKQM